jgi:virginiamycin B lyase
VYDPDDASFEEWPVPGGRDARPYAMAADDRGRIWFVESGTDPNRVVGFDPETERFFGATPIPSGGGTVRHMVFHAPTRTLWFGTDANTIGRAHVP